MRVAFAECVFDSEVRALVRAGAIVHLSPKAFRLLELQQFLLLAAFLQLLIDWPNFAANQRCIFFCRPLRKKLLPTPKL